MVGLGTHSQRKGRGVVARIGVGIDHYRQLKAFCRQILNDRDK